MKIQVLKDEKSLSTIGRALSSEKALALVLPPKCSVSMQIIQKNSNSNRLVGPFKAVCDNESYQKLTD